jgi:hypothetical protein
MQAMKRLQGHMAPVPSMSLRLAHPAETAFGQMLDLVALSRSVAVSLDAGDSDKANKPFREAAFPHFKDIWAAT